jgi:hypothetical protein
MSTFVNLKKFPEISDEGSLNANFDIQENVISEGGKVHNKITIASRIDIKVVPSASYQSSTSKTHLRCSESCYCRKPN